MLGQPCTYTQDRETTKTCILENGAHRQYHVCTDINNDPMKVYDLRTFDYIGSGTIHTINGYPQRDKNKYHFYIRRKN